MTSTTTEPAGPAPVHSRRLRRIRAFTGAGLAVAATLALVGVLMEPTPESKATTVTLESVAVTRETSPNRFGLPAPWLTPG